MRNGFTRVCAVAVCALLPLLPAFGQEKASNDPVVNFGIKAPEGGVIVDWTGNAKIQPGSTAEIVNGPFGAKALAFSGKKDAVSALKLTAKAAGIRNAKDLSVSFSILLNSEPGKDIDTGLGMKLNGLNFSFGDDKFSLAGKTPLPLKKWIPVAFVYSADREEARIYVDGQLDNAKFNGKLSAIQLKFDSIGLFDGSVSTIQIWDRALDDDEIVRIPTDEAGLVKVRGMIEANGQKVRNPQMAGYLDDVQKKIIAVRNQKTNSIRALDNIAKTADTALRLIEGEWFFRKTSLAEAPFSLIQIQAISKLLRSPDVFPNDADFTANLRVAAAKGEYEPLSFVVYPFRGIDDFTIEFGDFKSDGGATLPASIVDRKIVKFWYQADWNSRYNSSTQILVPDLLVNDDKLLSVDEVGRKNYLRTGKAYTDVNFSAEAAKNVQPFNYCKEDVRDAKTIQGVALTPGRGTQFWYTFAVPKNAKSGLYTAAATAKSGGKELASFKVTLRVYPFELPDAKTNYDLKRDYITTLAGSADLARYAALAGSASDGENFFRDDLKDLLAHGIRHPAIPAPGKDPALFERDLKIRKELGFTLNDAFIAAFPDDGSLMTGACEKPGVPTDTAEAARIFKKIAGNQLFFFYGMENGDPANVEKNRTAALKNGNILTAGWNDGQAILTPTLNIMHATPDFDDNITEKWHAVRGRVISCGWEFAGPDNPDIFRRKFGVMLHRADYDGFFLPAYPDPLHCWNERCGTGIYRNQIFSYPTAGGPINSIAYEGLREGIDDVRYVTLLNQLLDEAFAKNNLDAKYAAKKAMAIYQLIELENMDLDLMRAELADHITLIMKRLGKEIE